MKTFLMIAFGLGLFVTHVGDAMAQSTCASEVARVKKTLEAEGSSVKVQQGKASAQVKIREAEEALAKKDESGCIAAVQAADAAIK